MEHPSNGRPDAPVRQRFEHDGLKQCRRGARMFAAFAVALLMLSAAYSGFEEREIFAQLLHIRLIALLAAGAVFVLLGRQIGARRARELAVALMLVMTFNNFALAQWTGGQLSPQYDRLAFILLAAAVLMTWSAAWALAACGLIIGAFVVQSAVTGGFGSEAFFGNLLRLCGASAISVAASAVRERRRWRDFWQVHTLTEARREADEQVRRLNEELEQRVLERTVELRTSEERARAMFEAARAHQGHLAHVLRVTTMEGMAAELAHELNQPLGAIVNFANGTATRLRQSGADPELAASVSRIADEGMRAAEIIRRVREFVRPGGVVRQAVNLNDVVREVALLIDGEARRDGIPVSLNLDGALPPVAADRIQVEQVVLNLVRNAIEAMRGTGGNSHALVVETAGRPPDDVELRVRDTGEGIAPETAARMFEAFFTTKSGGLGMGLSISRSIVEAYGGKLWAEANPGGGMTFGFQLPIGEGETSEPDGGAAPPSANREDG